MLLLLLLLLSLQSCLTLCNPIDCSLPGSPVPGILQARTLEWAAIAFSSNVLRHCNSSLGAAPVPLQEAGSSSGRVHRCPAHASAGFSVSCPQPGFCQALRLRETELDTDSPSPGRSSLDQRESESQDPQREMNEGIFKRLYVRGESGVGFEGCIGV